MKYSVVFPCYNEAANLPLLIESLEKFPKDFDVEFIIVQNGSTDDSPRVLKKIREGKDTVVVVDVPVNKGYGYGIKQGILQATGSYVCWMHSDMQLSPLILVDFFKYIEVSKKKHLFMKGARKNRHLIEYFFTTCMGIFESLLFRTYVHDVMSMPVIIRRDLIADVSSLPDDFSIDIYTYILAKRNKQTVIHLPVYMKDREGGISSWNTGLASRIKQSIKMIRASLEIKL